MALKLRTKEYQEWVEVTAGDMTARVLIRPMPNSEVNKLFTKFRKRSFEKGMQVFDIDVVAFRKEKTDYCVRDWSDIFDENDQPLPCTRANKLLLLEYSSQFIDAVLEKADAMAEFQVNSVQEEQENL